MRTQSLSSDEFLNQAALDQVLENRCCVPDKNSLSTTDEFCLSLKIPLTKLKNNSEHQTVNEKNIDCFPQCELRLVIDNGTLIPLDRDLVRDQSGQSYWDISLSPGEVWKEADDNGWSRAVLPFQLSNIFENDSHHGLLTFLYQGNIVSPLYVQVIAETKAFLAPDDLVLWGFIGVNTVPLENSQASSAIAHYANQELPRQRPIKSLDEFRSAETVEYFEGIEEGFGAASTLISGLVIDNTIYITPCNTKAGLYPYPAGMKFGIWSATKTAFCTLACLRLAQKTGEDPRTEKIADLIPEAHSNERWSAVTIGDCLNMASGIGTAAPDNAEAGVFADYLLEAEEAKTSDLAMQSYQHYHKWFLAPSQHEKNLAAISCPAYSWDPGEVARYRDQDLYITGAALDALLKIKFGSDKKIWSMLRDEVYIPSGIYHAVKFHTLEKDCRNAVPLSDAGLLLSLDNIAAMGDLIINGGVVGGEQLLDPTLLDEVFNHADSKGLSTGLSTTDGDVMYHAATWHLPYRSFNDRTWWIPSMRGYGGQTIQILPNGMTAFRFGFDSYSTDERYDNLKLVRLADAIKPF